MQNMMAQGQMMMQQGQNMMQQGQEYFAFGMRGGKELMMANQIFVSQRITPMELCGCEFTNW